jgi:hypothetical protein
MFASGVEMEETIDPMVSEAIWVAEATIVTPAVSRSVRSYMPSKRAFTERQIANNELLVVVLDHGLLTWIHVVR